MTIWESYVIIFNAKNKDIKENERNKNLIWFLVYFCCYFYIAQWDIRITIQSVADAISFHLFEKFPILFVFLIDWIGWDIIYEL